MITSRIVEDSISDFGFRITTLSLVYPRFIHSEVMTHRICSKNAASSRAIPVLKMLEDVSNNPAMPVFWGKNQKGMEAEEELSEADQVLAKALWLQLRDVAVLTCRRLAELGLHKQTTNRLIEPWQHMSTVMTSTEWENMKNLRFHRKAQPEFKSLMGTMIDALDGSKPVRRSKGEWHLPYVQPVERAAILDVHKKIKLSVARCARVSYKTHEGEIDPVKDAIRYWELLSSGHMSPFEHQATPLSSPRIRTSGNFTGWLQYRKLIPGESVFREDEAYVKARQQFADQEPPFISVGY